MNLLAHAYLSFNNEDVLVGNMISDFVKGKKQFNFSVGVQKGIKLHRAIDAFTDANDCTKQAKSFFKPAVGLYAGAFVDVVYDYFLANDSLHFPENNLDIFCVKTYAILQKNSSVMPENFAGMLPYMQQQNWLYNYQYNWGIEKSFNGIVRRARYLQESKQAFDIFEKNIADLQILYNQFFNNLYHHAFNKYNNE
jgi:acyl carrier protein phosphodiesterase